MKKEQKELLKDWENEIWKWFDRCPEALPDFVWEKNWDYLLDFIARIIEAKDAEYKEKNRRLYTAKQMREAIEEAMNWNPEPVPEESISREEWARIKEKYDRAKSELFKKYKCEE